MNSEITRLEESIEALQLDLSNLSRLDREEARKAPTKNDLASLNQKIIKMEATLNALERKNRALQEESPLDFAGSGGRQRLSGCKLTGKHVAILMDISASMLEQTVADVYALQNEKELVQFDTIKGEVPSPLSPPTGCFYHPRCPIASINCSKILPVLEKINDNRSISCHEYKNN